MSTKLRAPEGDALVDRVAPLGRRQLVGGRGRAVVAVPAGAAAAVRHVQVHLAQAAEGFAAQSGPALEPLQHAEVRRSRRRPPTAGAAPRASRWRALRSSCGPGASGCSSGTPRAGERAPRRRRTRSAGRRRSGSSRRPRPAPARGRPRGQLGERPLEVLRRERRAVAADDHDDVRAVCEERGEDAGQPLAEPLAALPEPRPVAGGPRGRLPGREPRGVRGAAATVPPAPRPARARPPGPARRRPACRGAGARTRRGRRRRRAPSPGAS